VACSQTRSSSSSFVNAHLCRQCRHPLLLLDPRCNRILLLVVWHSLQPCRSSSSTLVAAGSVFTCFWQLASILSAPIASLIVFVVDPVCSHGSSCRFHHIDRFHRVDQHPSTHSIHPIGMWQPIPSLSPSAFMRHSRLLLHRLALETSIVLRLLQPTLLRSSISQTSFALTQRGGAILFLCRQHTRCCRPSTHDEFFSSCRPLPTLAG